MEIKTEATERVRLGLAEAGLEGRLRQLSATARSAIDAASSLNVEVAQIVKTLIFIVEDASGPALPVAVLISGDRRCKTEAIPRLLGMDGKVRRPDADQVKTLTGYSIGGVSPVAMPENVAVIIDASLNRHDELWAAAGHTHLVFRANLAELEQLTKGRLVAEIST